MAFELRFHEDKTTGLVAKCDVCGKLVKNAELANLCWTPQEKDVPGELLFYRIACKDRCTRALDKVYGHQYTQELDVAIGYLMNNSRVDMKAMRRRMQIINMIG